MIGFEWVENPLKYTLTDKTISHIFCIYLFQIYFDWELCRVREGYYQLRPGLDFGIQRALAYEPYSDLTWMETKYPGISDAEKFAKELHKINPHQKLVYNLSPSFNWDASGMTDSEISTFNDDLGELGYVFQLLSLAGFHSNGLMMTRLARDYGDRGMLAYIEQIQRREREEQVNLLTHQKWSGNEMVDAMVNIASGGISSTSSTGEGCTETQFSQ